MWLPSPHHHRCCCCCHCRYCCSCFAIIANTASNNRNVSIYLMVVNGCEANSTWSSCTTWTSNTSYEHVLVCVCNAVMFTAVLDSWTRSPVITHNSNETSCDEAASERSKRTNDRTTNQTDDSSLNCGMSWERNWYKCIAAVLHYVLAHEIVSRRKKRNDLMCFVLLVSTFPSTSATVGSADIFFIVLNEFASFV